ncbi:nuclear transport factor 2 family protein [Oscillatoria sp. FACHB-1407]|uniref:nuclear transport factor 2 family protein n=1 Tax=Oscillatoria sp. FACHB-1407 TaxID=2692847 RepID=UPI00168734C1|nr:nuclear transport factor 2 family protein [Oscillatoria sp. FACHB-1407]MBD2465238.1 nuclear transport factor 2 family protein [Oscillatoria sp. FACHB-1407]
MNRSFPGILCTVVGILPAIALTSIPLTSAANAEAVPLLAQTMPTSSTSEQTIRTFIQQIEAENLQGLGDLLAENVVLEQPYQLPGAPNRFEGKAAVQGFFQRINQTFSRIQFENLRVIVSADEQTVTVEGQGNFVIAENGASYQNVYIVVFEMRDGKIGTIREYFNPLILAQTFNIDLTGGQ